MASTVIRSLPNTESIRVSPFHGLVRLYSPQSVLQSTDYVFQLSSGNKICMLSFRNPLPMQPAMGKFKNVQDVNWTRLSGTYLLSGLHYTCQYTHT